MNNIYQLIHIIGRSNFELWRRELSGKKQKFQFEMNFPWNFLGI